MTRTNRRAGIIVVLALGLLAMLLGPVIAARASAGLPEGRAAHRVITVGGNQHGIFTSDCKHPKAWIEKDTYFHSDKPDIHAHGFLTCHQMPQKIKSEMAILKRVKKGGVHYQPVIVTNPPEEGVGNGLNPPFNLSIKVPNQKCQTGRFIAEWYSWGTSHAGIVSHGDFCTAPIRIASCQPLTGVRPRRHHGSSAGPHVHPCTYLSGLRGGKGRSARRDGPHKLGCTIPYVHMLDPITKDKHGVARVHREAFAKVVCRQEEPPLSYKAQLCIQEWMKIEGPPGHGWLDISCSDPDRHMPRWSRTYSHRIGCKTGKYRGQMEVSGTNWKGTGADQLRVSPVLHITSCETPTLAGKGKVPNGN